MNKKCDARESCCFAFKAAFTRQGRIFDRLKNLTEHFVHTELTNQVEFSFLTVNF